jgi:hypothetical protein
MNIPNPKTVAAKPVAPAPAPVVAHVNIDASKLVRASFKSPTADSQPCNWEITPTGEDSISCRNSVSGSTFEGTIAEFSAALKGL